MYPAKFEYYRAKDVHEALQLMAKHSGAKLLAGGHSLLPMMKLRLTQPTALIDIGRIVELTGVYREKNHIHIASLTTHTELANSELLREICPLLSEAASLIADPQVRNKGTIGGNLAHADPGSDLPAVILALDGIVHTTGPNGDRQIKSTDFFLDLLTTDLHPNELITKITVPIPSRETGCSYLKFEHPASGYSICGAAAIVKLTSDGTCQNANLCFNGISATPHRAEAVTKVLIGTKLEDTTIDNAFDGHLNIPEPIGDIYASSKYRVEMAKVYGRRALSSAKQQVDLKH